MLKLTPTLNFHPDSGNGKHWVVIGAGGNGGYYIPNLARAVSLANHKLRLTKRPLHQITIIDADDVEDKNLTRQNFLRADVGKKKAEVLANRYGRAFGLEIQYMDAYIDSPKMLLEIIKNGPTPVIVGAVDNNKTRKLIYDVFKQRNGTFWLDAGNEEWGGQVVLGYSHYAKADTNMERRSNQLQIFHMPCAVEIYPEILAAQDKLPHELSCAERAVSAPQNIFTNQIAASLMQGFTNLLINADTNKNEGIKHHAVAFNSRTSSFTTRLNTLENLTFEEPKVPVEATEAPTEVKAVKAEAVETVAIAVELTV